MLDPRSEIDRVRSEASQFAVVLETSLFTPQGLYMSLQNMQASSPDSPNILTNIVAKATAGHGICD
jgi:hypothetical protein